jgi:hypothetical protein
MVQIQEPKFHPDMAEALRNGRKCCTTRREKLGEPGDWWEKGDGSYALYRIVEVRYVPFGVIASQFHRLEGFESQAAFESFWMRIHRGHLPASDDMRWLHFIARIADEVEP